MSTEMNATETVQVARGQVWCGCGDGQGNCYSRRWLDYPTTGLATIHVVTEKCGVAHEPPWEPYPDPLADTPEGDHEWCEILRWRNEWLRRLRGELRKHLYGAKWEVTIAIGGVPVAKAVHENERIAELEALAAAIKGESMKEARE